MRPAAAGLAVLTVLRLLLAGTLPLTPDETYYWVWSRALAAGYVDHPPMVALWIHAGTALLGPTALGVRLLGPLAAAAETLLLADAAQRLLPMGPDGWRVGLTAGLLWNATLLVGVGSVLMTPDAPLLLFWCATLWAMARVVPRAGGAGGGTGWWIAAGLAAGLALVSKYTAAFLWLGLGIWLLADRQARLWLRRPAPWAAAVLGLAVFLPVVWWNAAHGWISFLKQGGRLGGWQPDRALGFLAELIGGQIGLATPGVWLLCVAGLASLVRRRVPSGHLLLLTLSLPAVLVFTQHAFSGRVQGNWPAIVYPTAVVAAAGLTASRWRRLVRPSAGLGFALAALVALQAAVAILPLPSHLDPTARQLAGWDAMTAQVAALCRQEGATFIAAEDYALTSELGWNAPAGLAVVGSDLRFASMTRPHAALTGQLGILVRADYWGDAIDPAIWPDAVPLGVIDRPGWDRPGWDRPGWDRPGWDRPDGRGIVARYRVWRVSGGATVAIMPRR